MATSKLQPSLNNIHSQLKMERLSSLAKDTRIKALEDLVIKLGYDPSNIKMAKEMIKNKNVGIQALSEQLKLPTIEHPQAKEVGQLERGKENMFKFRKWKLIWNHS